MQALDQQRAGQALEDAVIRASAVRAKPIMLTALAEESDPSTWYSGVHAAEGYTDYPTHAREEVDA